MRNRRYENLGTAINVQIENEYYVTAFINSKKRETSEYIVSLCVSDNESGLTMHIDKSFEVTCDYKLAKVEITKIISEMINDNYFAEYIGTIKNVYDCIAAIHAL